jgi:acyl dehydratase
MPRYLDDFKPGDVYESLGSLVTRDAIIAFASEFDPQPFHTDPEAATSSFSARMLTETGWTSRTA